MDLKFTQRLAELDWLRVILILAVFLHHVSMPFNGGNWHIMNRESSKVLGDIMVYFEQFRLPVLFLISGVGSAILLSKISIAKFAKERTLRLLIPLLVGMVFVTPPQSYIENIGEYESYWQAFPVLALKFSTMHLWFIEYLIVFALLAIPVSKLLSSYVGVKIISIFEQLSMRSYGLFLMVFLLIALRVSLKLLYPEDDKKIENLSSSMFYFFFFIAGVIFIHSQSIWLKILEHKATNFKLLLISSVLFYSYYYSPDLSEYLSLEIRWSIWWIVCCLVAWSATLTIIGYAQYYFRKTPKWLKTSNELIYPFYIFHQTVIVVVGCFIINWQASIELKLSLLLVSSFLITSAICWLIIYPFNLFRVLFGLKTRKMNRQNAPSVNNKKVKNDAA